MRTAFAIFMVMVGTVLFHFLSPWWWTPIASNWGVFDLTILITFAITGVVFVAVMVFLAYSVYKYRARDGHKAVYEPESHKLELWLTVITAVGVIGLLTPGLFAWADYVSVPEDAIEVEVVGRQWQWSYRYPGEDGVLGTTDIGFISGDNPFGIDVDDANGQDDILVNSNTLHLLIGQPVKLLLRSTDVLHNFYVPQFRGKMDMVPGMVTFFWLEPTRVGEFEVICAELCGTGHYAMRGSVVVEEEAAFQEWLTGQPTFAQALSGTGTSGAGGGDSLTDQGRQIAETKGCLGCHTLDGSVGVGPSWGGLYGSTETLDDGSTVEVDDAYLAVATRDPNAQIVEGYGPMMPPYDLNDDEMAALVAYIATLAE